MILRCIAGMYESLQVEALHGKLFVAITVIHVCVISDIKSTAYYVYKYVEFVGGYNI